MRLISLDTETTGLDFYHGAKPFFVTVCDEGGIPDYWEWPVDPLTRQPRIPPEDLEEIQRVIEGADEVVLQNAKFDIQALMTIMPGFRFPYEKVQDTLLAAHVLESLLDKGLDKLASRWLRENINPLEDQMEKVVQECRRYCRSKLKDWAIAKEGRPDMPSATEKTWKYDLWLPRALADHLGHPPDHPYRAVTTRYACKDSEVTLACWLVARQRLVKGGWWAEYAQRRQIVPINVDMEVRGVSCVVDNFERMGSEYAGEVNRLEGRLFGIAASLGVPLDLPKGARNDSMEAFCFTDPRGLRLPILAKTDTGKPSMDKEALEDLENTLPPNSKGHLFIKALRRRMGRVTAMNFMESYGRFWVPIREHDRYTTLHPNLKPAGTRTTRWSCSNPNEQNISKRGIEVTCIDCRGSGMDPDTGKPCNSCYDRDEKVSTGKVPLSLRYGFGPAPGREWWSCDAKNLELRIPAYESDEKEMVSLFEQPDLPPYKGSNHMLNFHTIYPDLWEAALAEVGPDKVASYVKKKYAETWYQWCKNGGFAVLYGAVDRDDGYGTADLAFRKKGAHALLKARFARMEGLNQHWIRFGQKHGYVETMPRRHVNPEHGYPLMLARTRWSKVKPTQPLNYHVQGTACLWMQDAMIECFAQLAEWRRESKGTYDGFITMQVHDELVFDLPKRAHPVRDPKRSNLGRIRILQKLMEKGGTMIGVPTPTSCEYHDNNWSQGISL